MLLDILNYCFAAVIIFSLVVIAEVLINFKRPLILKFLFLVMPLTLIYRSVGTIYCSYNGYSRWLIDLPNSLLLAAGLCFFSIVYQYKLKWHIIIFGLLAVFTQFLAMIYFSYFHSVDTAIPLTDIPGTGKYMKALRLLFITVALAFFIYIFIRVLHKYQPHNIYFKKIKTWSICILGIMLFHWMANVLKYEPGMVKIIGEFMIPLGNILILLVILFRPKFLNRTNLKITLGDFFTKKIHPELDEQLFMETFFVQTYYLKQDASVENLCNLLNVSSDVLSNFIFTRYGSGLNDLINKHRIAYFIDLVNSGKLTDYTIDALAREAGFSSRHHLYKPFKKFHGGTPSDFVRSVAE